MNAAFDVSKLPFMLPERKQVLIVDDEPNLRKILSAQLTRDGYDVMIAEDGAQGLAMLRENHIDMVITDLKMPKVDGMTLLKEALREDPELPVVMITAHGTVDTAVEALKSGAFDYFTKPFDKDEVRQIVAKALKTKELSGAEARKRAPRAPRDSESSAAPRGSPSSTTCSSASRTPRRRF